MGVIIKEVLNKRDLLKWVRFPNKMYQKNKFFVPFLENDEVDTFTEGKNPAYTFCESRQFLAYKDGKLVGRIAGIINHAYNKKWDKKAIRFTRFDFIDDYEVSETLFNTIVIWGKNKGLDSIMGPIGFTDIDHEGMLVEGYEELNMSITFYNYPYYSKHMERLGLQKDADWIEYKINVPNELHPAINKISNKLISEKGFQPVTYTDREILRVDALEAFKVIDVAYSKLYGTVPLTPEVIKNIVDGYVPIINLDYVCAVKNSDGRIVAFGIMIPSIAKALKKSNGKLFPFGIFRLLKALKSKNDTLEMCLIAVEPEYQKQGVPTILMTTLLEKSVKNGVKYCETGPMLETNTSIHNLWKHLDKRQHKRRRCFIKKIED